MVCFVRMFLVFGPSDMSNHKELSCHSSAWYGKLSIAIAMPFPYHYGKNVYIFMQISDQLYVYAILNLNHDILKISL